MKTLSILFLSIILASTFLMGQVLLQENFTGAVGTQLVSAGWTLNNSTTNPLVISSPGLTFTGYPGSGVGNACAMANNGQDVTQSFTPQTTGDLYLSFMMNVSAALTGDYFIAFSPSTSSSNYYARLHLKTTTGGYLLGLNKNNEVTGGAAYGSTVLSLGTTYMVVVKYTFVTPSSTDTNDIMKVYVLSSGASIGSEPAIPEITYSTNTKADAPDLGFVTLRQGSATAAPTLVIDGIRVATSWLTLITSVQSTPSAIPTNFELSQNYPNPFNPSTTVSFSVARQGWTTLKVYNFLGQQVASAFEGNAEPNISYSVKIDGAKLASGTYFCTLQSGNQRMVKKMLLMK